jgi:hypothetical protein
MNVDEVIKSVISRAGVVRVRGALNPFLWAIALVSSISAICLDISGGLVGKIRAYNIIGDPKNCYRGRGVFLCVYRPRLIPIGRVRLKTVGNYRLPNGKASRRLAATF